MTIVKILNMMKLPSPLLLIFLLLISGCNWQKERVSNVNAETTGQVQPETPVKPKSYTKEAKLVAVGDILMHLSLTRSGYNPQKKTYNFDGFFKEVKPIISSADWAIANLETTLAGAAAGYEGYPLFNAPAEVADAAKKAGFDVLTTANNHALDKGEKGVINTINNVQKWGIPAVGTARSQKEASKILIIKKNDISMAIMAYTYGTNGIPIPKGKNYLVSLIDEGKIIKDIARARKQGAEIVTICLHFGDEYQRLPNAKQRQMVERLVKSGADIILGSHPHVVQPYQVFKVKGIDGKIRTRTVIYSMGNFIANQSGKYRNLGVIFSVNLQKRFPEKTVEITKVDAIPTWVHKYPLNGKLNFRVLPIATVVNRPKYPLLPSSAYPSLKKDLTEMDKHLKSLSPKNL